MVGRFAWGPSLFQGLFKDGHCAFARTFQDFDLFQGRSKVLLSLATLVGFNGFGVERNILIYSYLAKTSRWIRLIRFR